MMSVNRAFIQPEVLSTPKPPQALNLLKRPCHGALGGLSVCLASAAWAQGMSVAHSADDLLGGQFVWENDSMARGNQDRWYTNGIRYAWTYKAPPQVDLSKMVLGAGQWLLDKSQVTLTYAVGQNMYTPGNITNPLPQPNDRPWAAFTYAGVTTQAVEKESGRFSAYDVKLGLTGPLALGEAAQASMHTLIDAKRPQGWHQQLPQRVGIQLAYGTTHRVQGGMLRDYLGFQYGWGVAAGTLRVYGTVNASVILGDLRSDDPPLFISNEGDFLVQDFENRFMYKKPFTYLSVGATAVGYNHFLEGETPYGKSNIRVLPGYGTAQFGVSFPLSWVRPSWPRLTYTYNVRSAEFETLGVPALAAIQRWGGIHLNWNFY